MFSIFDFFNFDEKIYYFLTNKKNYDILFWDNVNLGTIATLSAVFLALYTAQKSIDLVHEQLKIEQLPLVVITDSIYIDRDDRENEHMSIEFMNIGRGPAVRITACLDNKNRDAPFFVSNESHSFELGANSKKISRSIDEGRLNTKLLLPDGTMQIFDKKNPLYIHIYFEDQMGNKYHRKAKFFSEPGMLKLMENIDYKN